MNKFSGDFLRMTSVDALVSRVHRSAGATLDELEGML